MMEESTFQNLCLTRLKCIDKLKIALTQNNNNELLKDIIDHENHLTELWKRLTISMTEPKYSIYNNKSLTNVEINRALFCSELIRATTTTTLNTMEDNEQQT